MMPPRIGAPIPAAQCEADRNVVLHAAQIAARKEADAADDALIEVISAELQERPGPPLAQSNRDRAARSASVFALGRP
jgi:hypothetical protein